MANKANGLVSILRSNEKDILNEWISLQTSAGTRRLNGAEEATLKTNSKEFLTVFSEAAQSDDLTNMQSPKWKAVHDFLSTLSSGRARDGYSPRETATFVLSLKEPLFKRLRSGITDAAELSDGIWSTTVAIDQLGLFTIEAYQKTREEIINRQQQELLELSTPVVRLWENILALPLIGTLDSSRTQVVMQNLLQAIVDTRSDIAIIDITGVPTVDTLVAQHLLKTVAAARLMGADCIISGIRPQIAQTIIHLGVDLSEVTTKATMADAFQLALQRTGLGVTRVQAVK